MPAQILRVPVYIQTNLEVYRFKSFILFAPSFYSCFLDLKEIFFNRI